ncbi:MAG: CtsR family transcriptional regulator [Oscillospiraceae bacterium]|nr:CtsR family transcriptional regulator [Oscillospiraceae bacterium]
MRISDIITEQILKLLDESEESKAEIQRNEFANILGCVPSQINYVLTSRFTPEQGYIVESRRGGGGYIRITRVQMNRSSALMHIINSIGDLLDQATARVVIDNCLHNSLISSEAAKLMSSAISIVVMRQVPINLRDTIRAAVIKQMLLAQI